MSLHVVSTMAKCKKLLRRAKRGATLKIDELRQLLRCYGFELARSRGSHELWKHPSLPGTLINIQAGSSGDAKPYQVRQVLAAIEDLGDDDDDDDDDN